MQTGRLVLGLLAEMGRVALFIKDALVQGLTPTLFLRQIVEQMLRIGYISLPVVGLTAFFTGGALALQIYLGSSRFNAESLVASIVALGITRELGPVLAGLMVAGRVGASIAAELGTMRVTEQIDALVTLSTNPFKYLVGPRLIAAVITLPHPRRHRRHHRHHGRLYRRHPLARLQLGYAYIKNTADFLAARRRHLGPHQGGRLRLHHRAHGLLSRLQFQGRRARRGPRHHQCRGSSASILILAANFVLTSCCSRSERWRTAPHRPRRTCARASARSRC